MKQCRKGHIYDEKKNSQCPYCSGTGGGFQPLGGAGGQPAFPSTVPISQDNSFPSTMPSDSVPQPVGQGNSGNMSVTVALDRTEAGINPVRGWLVAVDGDKKGMSFVIHGEQNSIGRGQNFDINLSFDKTVSSDGNAVIAYDSRNNKFFISPIPGKGKNNVYHNDAMLLMPAELSEYDRIQFGSVTYVFRSFCNDKFTY
ncbi:MAG: FHA domain-containing protein [Ruminococcus sp.]|nr:FHA domain-containing protein [Ruminococcus sp.]